MYENNGNVDLANLTLFDDISSEFGSLLVGLSDVSVQNFVGTGAAPVVNGAWAGDTTQSIINGGRANVGDTFEVVFTATIDPDAAGESTTLNNQGTAGGDALDANGNPLLNASGGLLTATDTSDNGVSAESENGEANTDGIFANDPTPVVIADLGIAKSVVGQPIDLGNGNFLVTFSVVVENTGTVDLENLSLLEDLASQFGDAFVNAGNLILSTLPGDAGSSISANSIGYDGFTNIDLLDQSSNSILQTGDSFEIQFDVEVQQSEDTEVLDNQVVGSGDAIDENGDPIMLSDGSIASAFDLSDSGTDPNTGNPAALDDTGLFNDPTSITLPGSGPIVNNGASGNPPRIPGLPPIASVPISQFLNGPGPIYSGIPINANANPLSLDSGRAVTGGYTGTGVGFGEGLGDCAVSYTHLTLPTICSV